MANGALERHIRPCMSTVDLYLKLDGNLYRLQGSHTDSRHGHGGRERKPKERFKVETADGIALYSL